MDVICYLSHIHFSEQVFRVFAPAAYRFLEQRYCPTHIGKELLLMRVPLAVESGMKQSDSNWKFDAVARTLGVVTVPPR